MKKYNIIAILACLVLMVGCGKDQISYSDGSSSSQISEYGYLTIPSTISVDLTSENFEVTKAADSDATKASDDQTKASDSQTEASDDYIVTITNSSADTVAYSASYGEFKKLDELALRPASYNLSVSSIEQVPSVGTVAHYAGSQSFVIVTGMTTSVENFSCTMSNIKISLSYSADLLDLFKEDSETNPEENFNVNVNIGNNSVDYGRDDSGAVYYFEAASASNTLEIELSGMYNTASANDDPSYTMIEGWKQTIDGTKAGQWRNISINIEHSNEGNANLVLTIDTWTYNEGIDVDVSSAVFSLFFVEPELDDPENYITDTNAPVVTLGENKTSLDDIFYIDYNSFTLSSALEAVCNNPIILNVDPEEGATLSELWIEFDSDNESFNALLEASLGTKRREYILPATSTSSYYTVDGNTFEASYQAMSLLYLYEGTIEVTIMAKDSEGRCSYSSMTIISTNEGVELPSNPPTIVWRGGNSFDETYIVDPIDGLEVIIDITSATGITGFMLEINSEVLTSEDLTSINLSDRMDLINPGSCEDGLDFIGFPMGDDVEGKTYLEFDISDFMPQLLILGSGTSNFVLEVTDAGGTTIRTLHIKVE